MIAMIWWQISEPTGESRICLTALKFQSCALCFTHVSLLFLFLLALQEEDESVASEFRTAIQNRRKRMVEKVDKR